MAQWRGNPRNPAPNDVQEPIDRSEKIILDNRPTHIRRDTDVQKDITVGFEDIDGAILTQLEQLQFQVVDAGNPVKVPTFYGSPQLWVSAKRDGYMRDKQGKLILPAIVFKRTDSADDTTLRFFNRYLNVPVMKRYSEKNQYTQFATLVGQNVPVTEIYNVVVPSHIILTYHFIVWTEYVEQMNTIIEKFRFNTNDYWGSTKGFRFRTRIESFGHTVELEAGDDRLVKTEFDLVTHGYILPDTITKLEKTHMTTAKFFTPKKIVMGLEVVATDYDMTKLNNNSEKWRNPDYPNLQHDAPIPVPPVSVNTSIVDNGATGIRVDNSPLFLRIVPVPTTQNAKSQDGDMSYDSQYFYLYINGWKRAAISEFIPACSDNSPAIGTEGTVAFNDQFFYIYSSGAWRRVAMATVTLSTPGSEGDVMYDTSFIYIYTNGSWRKMALTSF